MSLTPVQQLELLEAQLKVVSGALLAADPQDFQTSSATLQQLALEFLQLRDEGSLRGLDTPRLTHRLQALAQGLLMLREALLRRSAYVERALAVLVPQAQVQTTYSDSSTPYGSAGRMSGQLKGLAA